MTALATVHTLHGPATWFDTQPAPVRAVLDLAYARGSDLPTTVWDRIADTFAPEHAETIRSIADDLALAEDYNTGLRDHEIGGLDAADSEVARLRASALCDAQLIASLMKVTA